mmetsp:Transcript_12656/g.11211  ORF Transcript_12656/g.11211 Transcript_12656/m.11211 type:complete len:252 (+) Transcript_12656:868-1623(+)
MNLKSLEETERSPANQKTKSWLKSASNSFGNFISKANKLGDSIVPSIKSLLSSSNDAYDNGDLLVKRYSEKLELIHQSFVDLYKLATEIHITRSEECKIERGFYYVLNNCKSTHNQDLSNQVNGNFDSSKVRGDESYNNLVELEELLYATESHLVWIESVQDLIARKNELCEKLIQKKTEMKNSPLNHHEIESCKYLLELTERREKIIRGIRKEMEKFRVGTLDFYPRYVENKFIKSQLSFYTNSFNLYSK